MTGDELFFAARVMVVSTFLVSSLSKLRHPDAFHATIRAFKLATDRGGRRLVRFVVLVELALIGLSGASSATAAIGCAIACGVLVVYTVVLAVARGRGSTVGCNCFGATKEPVSWYDVIRNLLLVGIVLAGLSGASADAALPQSANAALIVAAVLGVLLVLINLRAVAETLRMPIASTDRA